MAAQMSPQELMQHELAVRQQVIDDLQRDNQRGRAIIENMKLTCNKLRDEVLFVTVQTHAVVKSMMLLEEEQVMRIPGHMLLKARNYLLEKGQTTPDDDKGTLVFLLRELTDEEKEKEQVLRKKVESTEKRIVTE